MQVMQQVQIKRYPLPAKLTQNVLVQKQKQCYGRGRYGASTCISIIIQTLKKKLKIEENPELDYL